MSALRTLLLIIDVFVAVTAVGGGFALVAGLENQRFSPEVLRRTPFRTILVPGLILAVIVGGAAAVATAVTIVDRTAGGIASAFAGAALLGFILTEVRILEDGPGVSPTEAVYLAAAVAMIVGGLLLL